MDHTNKQSEAHQAGVVKKCNWRSTFLYTFFGKSYSAPLCVCVRACVRVCVRACACVRARACVCYRSLGQLKQSAAVSGTRKTFSPLFTKETVEAPFSRRLPRPGPPRPGPGPSGRRRRVQCGWSGRENSSKSTSSEETCVKWRRSRMLRLCSFLFDPPSLFWESNWRKKVKNVSG